MDESIPQQSFFGRIQEKLAKTRFAAFSLLLHIIIVLLVGSKVIYEATSQPDFEAQGTDGLVAEDAATAGPPPADIKVPSQEFNPNTPPPVPNTALDVVVTSMPSTTSMQIAAPALQRSAQPAMDASKQMSAISKVGTSMGMAKLPGSMAGRAGGTARATAMMKMGGKEKSEKAVLAGLKWLKEHQNEDGSWADRYKPSMTGLAVLCFLGHGEIPTSPEFGPTVLKGVNWLLNNGVKFQGHLCMTAKFPGGGGVYEHAIAAYALGEYYTMTKDDRVKDVLVQAVTYIVEGQKDDGGWVYAYGRDEESDTSVSGWQIQALKAAHLTGLNIPGVDLALDKAMLNLKRVQAKDGSFGYRNGNGGKYSLTGVGVLCSYFWTEKKDRLVTDGIKYIIDKSEKDYPVVYKGEKTTLYAWYYHTQACLMVGGSAWAKWNRWFQDQVVDNQSADGSWPPLTGNPEPGGLERNPDSAGPFYRTSLCILMLEVYYRYMPTTKA